MSEIVKDIVYLNNLDDRLTEGGVLSKFAGQARQALLSLYYGGLISSPLRLSGNSAQINAFMKTLNRASLAL